MASARPHGNPLKALVAFAALCALAVAIGVAGSADAVSPRVLGKTKRTPKPACPGNPCSAVGNVTGFQKEADGREGIFRAKKNGKIVAFALDLSKPDKSQREFLGDFFRSNRFGKTPTARIAVIRRAEGSRFRLKRQSPVVKLNGLLGQKQYFTLNKPLRMRKGDVLALTVPTWASSFATGLRPRDHQWLASRKRGKCSGNANIKNGSPHQKVDTVRQYGCAYDLDRLLYWGYFVGD